MAKATTKNTEATTVVKEEKVMTTKKATKKVEKEVVKNAEKEVVSLLKPTDFANVFSEAGIKCGNPECRDIYRLMGGRKGSSLVATKQRYNIYTTDEDFELVKDCKIEGITVIEGGNSVQKVRRHIVEATTTEALKAVLKLYAQNPFNQVVSQ